MLHDKGDGVAAFAATKTLVDLLCRRHGKGWGLLVVKRAKTQVIGPTPFQFNECTYYIQHVNAGLYFLYGRLSDQENKYR
jgi:hypothetical protein